MTKLFVTAIIALAFSVGAMAQEPGAGGAPAPAPAVEQAPKADTGAEKKEKKGKKAKKEKKHKKSAS